MIVSLGTCRNRHPKRFASANALNLCLVNVFFRAAHQYSVVSTRQIGMQKWLCSFVICHRQHCHFSYRTRRFLVGPISYCPAKETDFTRLICGSDRDFCFVHSSSKQNGPLRCLQAVELISTPDSMKRSAGRVRLKRIRGAQVETQATRPFQTVIASTSSTRSDVYCRAKSTRF